MVVKHRPRRFARSRRGVALAAVASAALWTSTAAASPALSVDALKTNGLSQPLGIGDATPDFSWKLNGAGRAALQSAYEVRVAASEGQLRVRSVPVAVREGGVGQVLRRRLRR